MWLFELTIVPIARQSSTLVSGVDEELMFDLIGAGVTGPRP
jgi:hypothetical protein